MHTKKGLPHELCFVFLFIVLVSIEDLLDFYSPVALSQHSLSSLTGAAAKHLFIKEMFQSICVGGGVNSHVGRWIFNKSWRVLSLKVKTRPDRLAEYSCVAFLYHILQLKLQESESVGVFSYHYISAMTSYSILVAPAGEEKTWILM